MKRNGFTLVELLAVIVLLGLVIVIVATSGFGAFDKTKNTIAKIEEENLLEAAKTYLVELDNEMCTNKTENECIALRNDCLDGCIVIVKYLEDNDYFNDKKDKCKDDAEIKLKIEVDDEGNTTGYSATKITDSICVN